MPKKTELFNELFQKVLLYSTVHRYIENVEKTLIVHVKVGPPVHNYEHEAGSYGDGFT